MAQTRSTSRRKTREGIVVSDRMDKTVVVRVERLVRHPLYGRVLRRRKKYMAHDENNECRVGDLVRIMECRPLSRHKSWRVVEIIRRADTGEERIEAVEESVEVTEEVADIIGEAAGQQAEEPEAEVVEATEAPEASAQEQAEEEQEDEEAVDEAGGDEESGAEEV